MADTDAPNDGDRRDNEQATTKEKASDDDDSKGLEEISSDEDEASYAEPAAGARAALEKSSSPTADDSGGDPTASVAEDAVSLSDAPAPPASADDNAGGKSTHTAGEEECAVKSDKKSVDKVDEESVDKVDEESVGKVDEESVGKVDEESVGKVDEESVGKVDEESVGKVDEESVGKVDEESVDKVDEDSVDKVDEDSVDKVDEESVDNVDEESVDKVDEESVDKVDEESVDKVDEESVDKVDVESVDKIDEESVDKLDESVDKQSSKESVDEESVDKADETSAEESADKIAEDNADKIESEPADDVPADSPPAPIDDVDSAPVASDDPGKATKLDASRDEEEPMDVDSSSPTPPPAKEVSETAKEVKVASPKENADSPMDVTIEEEEEEEDEEADKVQSPVSDGTAKESEDQVDAPVTGRSPQTDVIAAETSQSVAPHDDVVTKPTKSGTASPPNDDNNDAVTESTSSPQSSIMVEEAKSPEQKNAKKSADDTKSSTDEKCVDHGTVTDRPSSSNDRDDITGDDANVDAADVDDLDDDAIEDGLAAVIVQVCTADDGQEEDADQPVKSSEGSDEVMDIDETKSDEVKSVDDAKCEDNTGKVDDLVKGASVAKVVGIKKNLADGSQADDDQTKTLTVESGTDVVKVETVGEGDDEAAKSGGESEMPFLAILDVRTVTEDDAADEAKDDAKPKGTDDSEMKNYAADTMNELLGLFGYEKVDDNTKDAIQLSNNLSGPADGGEESTTTATATTTAAATEDGAEKVLIKKTVVGEGAVTAAPVAVKMAQGRTCSVCNKTRSCKYQVLMLGTTKFLCDDNCFREFRTKQKITSAPAIKDIIAENRPITRSLTNPKDHCNLCHKEIRNGLGLLPGVGENKPLCSEECMRQYQSAQGLKRGCAQCGCQIQSRSKCLTWEAMEFCNEECLGKYQSYLGSHCAYCNHAVQQTSLGKYCVRFGSDIKQFCSNGCLEEFKKGLKVCSYCQKDISTGTEGFLAPVGDKGQFKEFCSQSCMEKYETMGNVTPIQPSIEQCSVCNKVAPVKVEVTFDAKIHRLCSEPCIAAFRYANKINTSICDTCHKFFDLDVSRQLTIQFEGTSKRFCAKACMNVFVLYHRKVVPCSWCKVKKYNFDMIERVDSNNHVQLFCSLNCLSLFRVSLNATSSRKIQCDFCHHSKPAQYHLTMSDASIRNFCSYNCVMQFQGQFTTLAPVVNAPTAPGTVLTTTNSQTTGTPVISSVMSLAPSQNLQQNASLTTTTTAKSIIIRPQSAAPVPTTRVTPVRGMSTQTTVPAVTQQVLVRNPPAKTQKNKMLMCKPMTQTKGVSCKPHPCHKTTQTEDDYHKPFMIPVPVPIFIPVPMRMYTTPVPYPLPFPLPIPVPIFIPTTKNSAQGIFKQIKEIQHKIPDNPFEADLILMAEMVADEESSSKGKSSSSGGAKLKAIEGAASPSSNMGSPDADEEGGFTVGSHMPDAGGAFGDDVLQMALRMASSMDEPVDLETALAAAAAAADPPHLSSAEENGAAGASYLSPRELRGQSRNHKRSSSGRAGRGRGRKRARTERERDQTPPPSPPAPILPPQFDMMAVGPPRHESNCVLKFSYGVNAWKHWVLQKNTQLEKASQSNRKLKLFKTDLLQLVADELNYSLCLFVKEVRKPNGEEYAPDSIYYLCLGIQQYLFENGRIDNIFADAYYEKFTECLNEVLQRYDITIASDGCFISRIEEEILWECKQLGAHSPHVLLNTLMYFNTKYFMLKTIDDHLQLSFTHILKHWKKTPGLSPKAGAASAGRNVLLRYYPSSQAKDTSRKRKESSLCYEQVENLENPLRCPVKLYEFYLSKCPESIKNRSDVFYLYPERSCVPDSPVWYSTMSLGKETIAKMLQRIRMIM